MKRKKQIDQKYFSKPVLGVDPITKGTFTIDYAFIIWGWENYACDKDKETLSAIGQITIDGNDTNPFYDVLIKTPLLIQDHPLSIDFGNDVRFIKIKYTKNWENFQNKIVLSNVTFEFLDNLDYIESITDFKDDNLIK